jgi:acyl-CoA thioester hydrolase
MSAWASGSNTDSPFIDHTTTIRVRYGETDAMGWVYYGNYYLYFEVGRTELIRSVWQSYRSIEDAGFRLPVIESGCRYLRGARYDDVLAIRSRMTFPTRARVRFDYTVTLEANLDVIAEGFTEHCFVSASGKPVAIPAELQRLMES